MNDPSEVNVVQLFVRELTTEEMPLWDELLAVSPQRSIFAQRWWMEIVTQGQVRLLGCFDDEQRLQAGLPIWPCTTLGIVRLRQPPLTPYWGPLLMPFAGKYSTRLVKEMETLRALAQTLDPWPDIRITFHPSLTNWLPFSWRNFTQTTRYTYRIDNLAENLPVGKRMHHSVRRGINRAESNQLRLLEMVDPPVIAEMSRRSMARQSLESSAEIRAFWPTLVQAARERQCIFSTAAVDQQGNVHAAFATLWDDRYAYDLYGGGDPRYRESGGGSYVVQHLMEHAATVAPCFDFEGSMIDSIGSFFRQFGGVLTPYYAVTRTASWRLNIARKVQLLLDEWRQRRRADVRM
jgi:hypothetical protein